MPSLSDWKAEGQTVAQHRPWPRIVVDARRGSARPRRTRRRAAGRCWHCGASPPRCTWRCWRRIAARCIVLSLECPDGSFLRSACCIRRRCGWSAPSPICSAWSPENSPDHAALARSRPMGPALPARRTRVAGAADGPMNSCRRRRGAAPDRGRPGPCRHHRARPFPLHRQWRNRGAAGAAAGLCAQGHRRLDGRRRSSTAPRELAGRVSGDSTVAYAFAFARAVEAALEIERAGRAPCGCAR